jgi:catechol 2,3-dioxygenase-like lactoylglutathione lyase family enzyme
MTATPIVDPHHDLHSEQGRERGEHPGRRSGPVIKVKDLAWLEFEKPDLERAEIFALDFGFSVHVRTADALYLRGTWSGTPCVVIRRGRQSRFIGPVFQARDHGDLQRLERATGRPVVEADPLIGGHLVKFHDPSGIPVAVSYGAYETEALADQVSLHSNFGHAVTRVNATQRPPREPARIQRLGHVVLMSTSFQRDLDWYLETFGLIVSDFLFLEGQRERGPSMAFIRCDNGETPSDHHTLAMTVGPRPGYVHSAYQVLDLDALAAGGAYLAERGYRRAWGIGRHIQGSQIFDYWRDPERIMVEHFTDGDLFDCTVDTGWSPMTSANLAQWGPPVTRDFLDIEPSPSLVTSVVSSLRGDNELDIPRLRALMKAMAP